MNKLLVIMHLAIAVSGCMSSSGALSCATEDSTTVHFAGVAYLGDYEYISANYPLALQLNSVNSEGLRRFDKKLQLALSNACLPNIAIETGLADLKRGSQTVMAIAVDREQISHETIGRDHKLIAEVSAQIVFFDFDSQTLVASFPVSIATNHVISGRAPGMEDAELLFQDIYLGDNPAHNLFDIAVRRLADISLNEPARFRVSLSALSLEEQPIGQLPEDLDRQRFEQQVGQFFVAQLSKQHPSIAVLPFTRGYTIANRMAGRFANGDVFNLHLPEPDFAFRVHLKELLSAEHKETRLYAARIKVKFEEVLLNSTYLEDDFQYAVPKLVTRSQSQIDHWAAFEDALESLTEELIGQFGKPDKKWVRDHARNASTSYQQLKHIERVFER